jgi:hypothetical protein
VYYVKGRESAKLDSDSLPARILILGLPLPAKFHCPLVRFLRSMSTNQIEIAVYDIPRITFNDYLLDNLGNVPLGVLWNESHLEN